MTTNKIQFTNVLNNLKSKSWSEILKNSVTSMSLITDDFLRFKEDTCIYFIVKIPYAYNGRSIVSNIIIPLDSSIEVNMDSLYSDKDISISSISECTLYHALTSLHIDNVVFIKHPYLMELNKKTT